MKYVLSLFSSPRVTLAGLYYLRTLMDASYYLVSYRRAMVVVTRTILGCTPTYATVHTSPGLSRLRSALSD